VGCVCEELETLDGHVDVDTATRSEPGELSQEYRDIYIKYQNKNNGQRLEPASLTSRAYNKLVVSGELPSSILDEDSVLPARKLAEAKQIIQQWINSLRFQYLDEDLEDSSNSDLKEYYDYLDNALSVISNTFKVTRYEVDDAAEAGRLFEVVNDRGKELTTAERVRSHLLYCCGEIDGLEAQEIARNFNEAIETITLSGGVESQIDQFIKRHWEIYTGETKRSRPKKNVDKLHRRIKQVGRYAPLDREPEEKLVNWVEDYVSTLHSAANAFIAIHNPDYLGEEYGSIDQSIIDKLHSIHTSGAISNFLPLLMAGYLKLGPTSKEFSRIVNQCEIFSFRSYQVVRRSTVVLRRELKQEAHRLYVADQSLSEIVDLFGERTLGEYHQSLEGSTTAISALLDNEIGKHAPEEEFIRSLRRNDILSGSFTTGWGGLKKDTEGTVERGSCCYSQDIVT
jgi:hypothetical protein